ncbi:unnamed protein product [Cercopithifilaria johnstoni]|uniref:Uncharacterized protein n=1 Tax=Cercopithifilaria johnstoni TaxID=2874296 RepID=A0A8J2M2Y4_9BILA|nr:unnamed protein product [Cercopithifilaria johnstoni]
MYWRSYLIRVHWRSHLILFKDPAMSVGVHEKEIENQHNSFKAGVCCQPGSAPHLLVIPSSLLFAALVPKTGFRRDIGLSLQLIRHTVGFVRVPFFDVFPLLNIVGWFDQIFELKIFYSEPVIPRIRVVVERTNMKIRLQSDVELTDVVQKNQSPANFQLFNLIGNFQQPELIGNLED